MDTMICPRCNTEKPIEDFPTRGEGKHNRRRMCSACKQERRSEVEAEYNEKNKEYRRARWHTNPEYRQSVLEANKRYRERNKVQQARKMSARRFEMRVEVIKRYGGRCACCGEDRMEFLAIDHINGGGTKERKEINPSGVLWKLYKAPGLLPGYRVLCHNCNMAFAIYGYCPHGAR